MRLSSFLLLVAALCFGMMVLQALSTILAVAFAIGIFIAAAVAALAWLTRDG